MDEPASVWWQDMMEAAHVEDEIEFIGLEGEVERTAHEEADIHVRLQRLCFCACDGCLRDIETGGLKPGLGQINRVGAQTTTYVQSLALGRYLLALDELDQNGARLAKLPR